STTLFTLFPYTTLFRSFVLAGISLYFSASAVPMIASLAYVILNVPLVLVFDGAMLLFVPLYVQRTFFGGGYVRLPPEASEPRPRSEEHTSELQSRVELV